MPVRLGTRRESAFLAQLVALKDGVLFAGRCAHSIQFVRCSCFRRYKIESDRIQGKPYCRYAVERSTGRSVFLKFFPRDSPEFENAVRMHSTLATGHKYICQYAWHRPSPSRR